jgi:hypothetical protein
MIRSEAEQLIGFQLIKALSNLKQNAVTPPSSSNLRTSFEKETVAAIMGDNQRCSKKLKHKIKSHKPAIKVVRDMLTRKWIFIKKDKQLDDSTSKSFSTSNFKAFKKLIEVAMFMEVIKKLTEATERKTKVVSDKRTTPQREKK